MVRGLKFVVEDESSNLYRLLMSEHPARVFISSAIGEFLEVRRQLHERINCRAELDSLDAWIYEHTAGEHGHEREVYLRALARSQIVVVILGRELREGTKEEVLNRAENQHTIFFVRNSTDAPRYAEMLGPINKWVADWKDDQDLIQRIITTLKNYVRQAVHDYASAAPQAVPPLLSSNDLAFAEVPEVYVALSKSLASDIDLGNSERAFARLEELEAATEGSDAIEVANLRAFLLRRSGNFDEAAATYRTLWEKSQRPRFAVSWALCLLYGNQPGAESVFGAVEAQTRDLSNYYLIKAQFELAAGNFNSVLANLRSQLSESRRRNRFAYDVWTLRGFTYCRQGRYVRAAAAYRKALPFSESLAPVARIHLAFNLGKIAEETGNMDALETALNLVGEGRKEFQRTMISDKSDQEEFEVFAANLHGALLFSIGAFEEAASILLPFEGTALLNGEIDYNLSVVRYVLHGEKIPEDKLRTLAENSGSKILWFNYLSRKIMPLFNGDSVSAEEIDSFMLLYATEFGEDIYYDFFAAVSMIVRRDYPSAERILKSVYREAEDIALRINALNVYLISTIVFLDGAGVDEIVLEAERLDLRSFDFVSVVLQYCNAEARFGRMFPTLYLGLRVARAIPKILQRDRSRKAMILRESLEWVASNLAQQAIVSGQPEVLHSVLEELKPDLSAWEWRALVVGVRRTWKPQRFWGPGR